MVRTIATTAATLAITLSLAAQNRPAPVTSVRLYVFENGFIRGLDTKLFNLAREDVKEPDFVNSSYLIVHPRGTLQFDAGGIPDSAFKGDGATVTEGVQSATKPLLPQLVAAGYRPADVTYFALSHYHSDHTGTPAPECPRPACRRRERTRNPRRRSDPPRAAAAGSPAARRPRRLPNRRRRSAARRAHST